MKRNAVFRIVLWSVVLLVLLAMLFFLLYMPGAGRRMRDNAPVTAPTEALIPLQETMVTIPMVTSPVDTSACNAIAAHNLNIRNAPHSEAEVVGIAEQGTALEITRQESVNGSSWGYITAPVGGWVAMEYVELLDVIREDVQATIPLEEGQYNAVVSADGLNVRTLPSSESPTAGMVEKGTALQITRQETVNGIHWGYISSPISGWVAMDYVDLLENQADIQSAAPQDQQLQANAVAMDAASVREMEIEWAAGSIVIQPKDITEIYIMEEGLTETAEPMVWKLRDGKLAIQYSKNTDHDFGMGLLRGDESKDLIIQVPFDWQCNSLEIDAASASLEVNDLTIREMEFDGASGTCVFNNCTVETLELDTASGDVLFQGSLNKMDCDAASANIVLDLKNVPKSLDLDTASGDLDVVLPQDAGFTVKLDTMSGEFSSDFATTNRNGSYIAGNGRCMIDVDSMSGSVNIRKGA